MVLDITTPQIKPVDSLVDNLNAVIDGFITPILFMPAGPHGN